MWKILRIERWKKQHEEEGLEDPQRDLLRAMVAELSEAERYTKIWVSCDQTRINIMWVNLVVTKSDEEI